jgi:hypothetical protein
MVQAINTHSTTAPVGRRIEYAWRALPRSRSCRDGIPEATRRGDRNTAGGVDPRQG